MVLKDPLGLSWQIVPRRFRKLIQDENPRKVKAVMDAMMKMVKLDVAALEKAYKRTRDRNRGNKEYVVDTESTGN